MVEIDPHQNLIYFAEKYPEEAKKYTNQGNLRRLQEFKDQPPIEADLS